MLLAVATGIILLLQALRQPPIVGYIFAGIFLGPSLLGITNNIPGIDVFGHIGIAFLLFILGINIDLKSLKQVGVTSVATGLGQIIFTFTLGYLLALAFGFGGAAAIYLAVALTFSSTVIIVKLLGDRKEVNSLHGRVAVGFLIVQDVVAVCVLLFISAFAGSELALASTIGLTLLQAAGIFGAVILITRYLLPYVLSYAGKNQEVLFVFSIAWCFILAGFFEYIHFGLEIGALIAGLTLAGTQYRYEIASKIKPLRDFFIIIFFIILGAQLDVLLLREYMPAAIAFSVLVLIAKPFIVMTIMGLQGFSKKTSFLVGVSVSQISEFGLIIVALGLTVGHVSTEVLNLVTVIALATILISTYWFMHARRLYDRFHIDIPYSQRGLHSSEHQAHHAKGDFEIILFGYDFLGQSIVQHVREMKKDFLVVDFDPHKVTYLQEQGIRAVLGDARDAGIYDVLDLQTPQVVISTLTHGQVNNLLLTELREKNKNCVAIVCTDSPESAPALYDQGADYVIVAERLGGMHIKTLLKLLARDPKRFKQQSKEHKKSFTQYLRSHHAPKH